MTLSNQDIARMLRLFRITVPVAASRMEWAPDWPLDRLMCEAADRLDPQPNLNAIRGQNGQGRT